MKLKDTDYLYATMRIRANEKNLLDSREIDRLIDSKTIEEAGKMLADAGYSEITGRSLSAVERALQLQREETTDLLKEICENRALIDVFALKYDFHNIKAVLKARQTGEDPERLMSDSGTIPKEVMLRALNSDNLKELPEKMSAAIAEAKETLAHTAQAQLADFILDRAYFDMMADVAKESGSEFLQGYVSLLADVANLRAAVRVARRKAGSEVLLESLVPGGKIANDVFLTFDFETGFSGSALAEAAVFGADAAKGARGLLEFERELDNALIKYMQSAKYVAFDERPLVAYVAAREAEATTIRIIMAGKLEGLSADEIRSRLRLSYV